MKLGDALTVMEEQLSNAATSASSRRDSGGGAWAQDGLTAMLGLGIEAMDTGLDFYEAGWHGVHDTT